MWWCGIKKSRALISWSDRVWNEWPCCVELCKEFHHVSSALVNSFHCRSSNSLFLKVWMFCMFVFICNVTYRGFFVETMLNVGKCIIKLCCQILVLILMKPYLCFCYQFADYLLKDHCSTSLHKLLGPSSWLTKSVPYNIMSFLPIRSFFYHFYLAFRCINLIEYNKTFL